MRLAISTLSISVVALTFSSLQAQEVVNKEFGFRFRIPDGFRKYPTDDKDLIYSFVDRDPTPDNPATVIQIQRLHGTIDPKQRMSPKDLPKIKGLTTTLEETVWNGHTLDVLRQVAELGNRKLVTYGVQFPLHGEAVQLQVGAPEEREAEIRRLFDQSVVSFSVLQLDRKPSNNESSTPSDSGGSSGFIPKKLRLLVALVVIGLIVALVSKLRGRRKAAK